MVEGQVASDYTVSGQAALPDATEIMASRNGLR
jgi:hypothetical protein